MTNGEDNVARDLDELNALHVKIGTEFVTLLEEADGWQKARLMVQYREDEDYQWSLRHIKNDGQLAGVEASPTIKELTMRFRAEFDGITGEGLKRLRMNLEPSGRFSVEYSYDEPTAERIKWDWPDETQPPVDGLR